MNVRGLKKKSTAAKPTYPHSIVAHTTMVSIVLAASRVATPAVTPWKGRASTGMTESSGSFTAPPRPV